MTRLIPASPTTGTRSMARIMFSSIRSRSSAKSSCPKPCGVPSSAQNPHVLLVGAHQQALPLLAQVILPVAVGHGWQAPVHRGDLGNGLGDEILVFGGQKRQRDPRHRRNLARPEAGGIHHPWRADIALFGAHDPCAVRLRLRRDHGREAVDFRPPLPRAERIGVRHARGVDVAAIGLEHDQPDTVIVHQRMQPLGLGPAHLVEIHAVAPRLGLLQAQLMLPVLGLREVERPGLEHAAGLAGPRPPTPCRGSSCNAAAG